MIFCSTPPAAPANATNNRGYASAAERLVRKYSSDDHNSFLNGHSFRQSSVGCFLCVLIDGYVSKIISNYVLDKWL
ncbi:hypothetical protein EUGRSUZ_B03928 [Eucalyptus grandis]|uniref:Uncharacterized protein n=2 Tax=Eucalyptus grandis TaxID=71139 RepID=A0ACC3LZD1_EUCGR|nr:hypothetical protein EUGRSUZ_B03928 [Eucalyptus grandis]